MSILEGELAGLIGDALLDADIPLDVVVTRSTPGGGGDPWDPDPGTSTDYPCQGYVDMYTALERVNTSILATDVKIIVVANTLAIEPSPADTVTVRGQAYAIVTVGTDPARALWELQGRA